MTNSASVCSRCFAKGVQGSWLDNIPGLFKSSALEAFLTAESFTDRALGLSKTLTFPTCVMVLISGNKCSAGRRSVPAHPDGPHGCRHRGSRAPKLRGRSPRTLPRAPPGDGVRRADPVAGVHLGRQASSDDYLLPSFEAWDDLIRQAAIWLGAQGIAEVADPVGTAIAEAKKSGPGALPWACSSTRFGRACGKTTWRAKDIASRSSWDEDLREALDDIGVLDGNGKVNTKSLGRWFARHAETRRNGRRFVRAEQSPKRQKRREVACRRGRGARVFRVLRVLMLLRRVRKALT